MAYSYGTIDEKTCLDFLCGHKKEHFMQTPVWGAIKADNGWTRELVGFFDASQMQGCAMILKKRMPGTKKYICYCPRGPVCDYADRESAAQVIGALGEWLRATGGVYLTMDPDVVLRARDKYDTPTADNAGLTEFFTSLGLRHGGYNLNFENNQPRFTFRLDITAGQQAVWDNMDRMARKNLNIADESCIEVYKSDDLAGFFEIMRDTAERDEFYEGADAYYERLYPALRAADMGQLYYARYNAAAHLAAIDGQTAAIRAEIAGNEAKMAQRVSPKLAIRNTQLAQKCERIEKGRATAAEYAEKYPDGLDLSALITINTPNRMWTVFGGSRSELRQLAANYKITWVAILDAIGRGMEFADFFGSTGDTGNPDNRITGIYAFKKKFSGDFIEFPGEFYLVADPFMYRVWTRLSPALLRVKRALSRRRSRG